MAESSAERDRRARIVRYWRSVEILSPQKVEAVDSAKNVFAVGEGIALPWEPRHAIQRRAIDPGRVWRHTVYAGVFDLERLRETLLEVFGSQGEDEDYGGSSSGDSAVLCFTVDAEGRMVKGSTVLSACAWAVGRAVSPGPGDPEWLDGFEEASEQYLATLLELADGRLPAADLPVAGAAGLVGAVGHAVLGAVTGVAANAVLGAVTGGIGAVATSAAGALGPVVGQTAGSAVARAVRSVGDAAATAAVDTLRDSLTGSAPDEPAPDATTAPDAGQDSEPDPEQPPGALATKVLTLGDLAALTRWIAGQLGVAQALKPDVVRVKSYTVQARQTEDAEEAPDFLNSFIVRDLDTVASALSKGDAGPALCEYLRAECSLSPGARTDVRQHPQVLLDGVSPDRAPLGRWPAAAKYPLALSQQFAVNTALAQLGGPTGNGLYAVNGPPGTGKTTMLRDLVAALVVQRAEQLAALPSARDAFGPETTWKMGDFTRRLRPPVARLTGFEIVIASSNNGAVENVTAEIPAAPAIADPWHAEADYLSQSASLLLGAPAWGAVAAKLGKRANRSDFYDLFWWGKEKVEHPNGKSTVERLGKGVYDILSLQKDPRYVPKGQPSRPADWEPTDPPLGTKAWSQAVADFNRAKETVQAMAAERRQVAATLAGQPQAVEALRVARLRTETAYLTADQAHQNLQAAEDEHAIAQERYDQAAEATWGATGAVQRAERNVDVYLGRCESALADVRAHDQQHPGLLRRIFNRDAVERWSQARQPLDNTLSSRQAAWEQAEGLRLEAVRQREALTGQQGAAAEVLAQIRGRLTRLQEQLGRAEDAAEMAAQAESLQQAAVQNGQQVLAAARQRWAGNVPGSEWRAPTDDTEAAASAAALRELSAPWMDQAFAAARSDLFLAAVDLHKALMVAEPILVRTSLMAAMDVVSGNAPRNLKAEQVLGAWQTLFLVVPVVSTTFASLDRLFAGLGSQALGWLFVDEAGQAAPQQVVGALWRTRRAIVVGDPLQLEPVVTVPRSAQDRLRQHFDVAPEWTPGLGSVQRLADRLNTYGTWIPTRSDQSEAPSRVWVGSPLRVHRRCDQMMFEVSNAIAYDGMMVFGTGAREPHPLARKDIWMHVASTAADDKWVPQQGVALRRTLDLIEERLREELRCDQPGTGAIDEDLVRRKLNEAVFVVSPFRDVVTGARKITKGRLANARVGTVHTTQGKEADIVILVLGTAPAQRKARKWAAKTPNLLNVAVSRARRHLLVIGDQDIWSREEYFNTLANHDDLERVDASQWGPEQTWSSSP